MLFASACLPIAVLLLPVVFELSATVPVAVLKPPVVLLWSAPAPVAVLNQPVVLKLRASAPIAVFALPELKSSAASPRNVLELSRSQPCLQSWARACGESAKPTSANVIRTGGMLGFISWQFHKISPACRGYSPQARIVDSSSTNANRRCQFEKSSQLFIRMHNEPVLESIAETQPQLQPALLRL